MPNKSITISIPEKIREYLDQKKKEGYNISAIVTEMLKRRMEGEKKRK